MIKNTSGQKIGAQMVSASDGSAFTGAVTVYVTGDAGTQAVGSVGSGACTHEGEGYHTYAPAQGETNYDLIAFTFKGTGAIPVTVQVFTVAGAIALEASVQSVAGKLSPIATKTGAVVSDGGNSATSFVTDLTETATDYWKDAFIRLTSGTLINQVKRITGYNGSTKAITVQDGFTGTPAAGVTFEIVND